MVLHAGAHTPPGQIPQSRAFRPAIGDNPALARIRQPWTLPYREAAMMQLLLTISRAIDALNERIGRLLIWLVLVMVLVSSANASVRYLLNQSSNAWLELQWYLFAAVFLGCAGYALLHNEHIRIDVVSSRFSRRTQVWIDIFGTVCFLLPVMLYITWLSWPIFMNAWHSNEMSSNAGGLIRWPARLMIPVGLFLLSLQGVSQLIKLVAFQMALIPDPVEKHASAAPVPLVINPEVTR
jgi:TRAP-type mannitol/chloroaromatic compound transport system permease small subunit